MFRGVARHRELCKFSVTMLKRIFLGIAVALLILQAIRPAKNASAAAPGRDDFIARFTPPLAVAQVLREACYDCHSNRTRYPWYAELQPFGWWLANHINEGKDDLNFSEFGAYSARQQAHKLNAIADQVSDRKMPLASYTWIHRDARLSDAQIAAITQWVDQQLDQVSP